VVLNLVDLSYLFLDCSSAFIPQRSAQHFYTVVPVYQLRHIPASDQTNSTYSHTYERLASTPDLLASTISYHSTRDLRHNIKSYSTLKNSTMISTMPLPQSTDKLPRNDSFSTNDITNAFKASATKPRNHLSLKVVQQDETAVPPPSPHESRPASAYGHREVRR